MSDYVKAYIGVVSLLVMVMCIGSMIFGCEPPEMRALKRIEKRIEALEKKCN